MQKRETRYAPYFGREGKDHTCKSVEHQSRGSSATLAFYFAIAATFVFFLAVRATCGFLALLACCT